MLQLKKICKKYQTGDLVQTALDNVSLNLRDNEFVAILGPSGSGKTTLLNMIGGLDRYDSGELIINGISTKKYTDRDWDSYRNHTIGFVFQSYNLIPHQTILANVELALTISGISKSERRKRANEALKKVGLGNQGHKKPNQLSGGQMQRVAIARALVNNPDILLADEPTGALDTDTSIQVMDLLKEVAKDRLVVMVTHNPELAEQYATRIVRLKDGRIISDSQPYKIDSTAMEPPHHENMGKSSMSFWTSLGLSFNNLWTKKTRTFMTAFAGSIGIIGIALILSISAGVNNYIKDIEEETLSDYPVQIYDSGFDMTSLLASRAGLDDMDMEREKEKEGIRVTELISTMFSKITSNDLGALQDYLESGESDIYKYVNAIEYLYEIEPQVYIEDGDDVRQVNPNNTVTISTSGLSSTTSASSLMSMMTSMLSSANVFFKMPENPNLYESQYEVKAGRWPENYNECVLVLTQSGSISDLMVYILGLRDYQELQDMIEEYSNDEEVESISTHEIYDYDDIIGITFKLVSASDYYAYDSEYDLWVDKTEDDDYMRELVANGEDLTIVGVVQPIENATSAALTTGVNYPSSLIEHVVARSMTSDIVLSQMENPDINVFTGDPFGEESDEFDLASIFSVDEDALADAFDFSSMMDSMDTSSFSDAFDMDSMEFDLDFSDMDFSDAFDMDSIDLSDAIDMDSMDFELDLSDAFDMDSFNLSDAFDSSVLDDFSLSDMFDMSGMMNPSAIPQPDLSAIFKELRLSDIDTSGLSSALESGYEEYLGENLDDEITSSFAEYLSGDDAQEIITDYIQSALRDVEVTDIQVDSLYQSIETYLRVQENDSSGEPGEGTDTDIDIETVVENEEEEEEGTQVLSESEFANLVTKWLQENNITLNIDYSGMASKLAAEYVNDGFISMMVTNFSDYMDESGYSMITEYMTESLLSQVETELEEAIYSYLQQVMQSYMGQIQMSMQAQMDAASDAKQQKIMEMISGAMSEAMAEQMASMSDTLADAISEQLSDVMESMMDSIADAISDQMASAMDSMSDAIEEKMSDAMSSLGDQIADNIESAMSDMMDEWSETLQDEFTIDEDALAEAFDVDLDSSNLSEIFLSLSTSRTASYDNNLEDLGYVDFNKPTEIDIYPIDFDAKEFVINILDSYNESMKNSGHEEKVITYTDTVGTLMSSVTTIVNVVSYVLVAFVSVSLIVSSIMIGIITYISVLERTREIGILRSIGASRRNISNIFNAETLIIGFCAGVLGVLVSLVLLIPINSFVHHFSGSTQINAVLPMAAGFILVLLSMVLTLIGGLIPSRSAAKKDMVSALRTE